MVKVDDHRRYVKLLAELVQGRDGGAASFSLLYDAEAQIMEKIRVIASQHIQPDVLAKARLDRSDFFSECFLRLFEKAKKNPRWLADPERVDNMLFGYIKRIALSVRGDLRKRVRKLPTSSIDHSYDDDDSEGNSLDPPADENEQPDRHLDLVDFQEWIIEAMTEFAAALRRPKLIQTFNAVLDYAGKPGNRTGVSPYWYAHQILCSSAHRPKDLRENLCNVFPDDKPYNVDQRLTDLRKAWKDFLRDRWDTN